MPHNNSSIAHVCGLISVLLDNDLGPETKLLRYMNDKEINDTQV